MSDSAKTVTTGSLASEMVPTQFSTPMPARKFKPLQEGRMELREFKQNVWAVFAPAGTTVEDLLNRDFWAHCAIKFSPMNKICVMTDDKRLYVELIVTTVGSAWAQVHVLGIPLIIGDVASNGSIADDYRIEDGGLHKKWIVVRKSDGAEIKSDGTLKTPEQAQSWLRDFLNSQGRRIAA